MRHKSLLICVLALGLNGSALTARADLGARLSVAVHALENAAGAKVKNIKLGEFQDESASDEAGIGQVLRGQVRAALAADGTLEVLSDDAPGLESASTLSGTYNEGPSLLFLHLELYDPSGQSLLWSRNVVLDPNDFGQGSGVAPAGSSPGNLSASSATDAAGSSVIPQLAKSDQEAPELSDDEASEGNVVPRLPRSRRHHRSFHIDFSAAYKAFFPMNGNFVNVAGSRQNAFDLGVDFNDVILWDVDFWNSNVSDFGSVNSLEYAGTDLSIVLPLHLGPFILYLGPSGRFGTIQVNDSNLGWNAAQFGTNAFSGVAGVKIKYDRVGADLRYSYDFTSTYTGFQTARLGLFYEFGD
jgi:hypothetical protein